MNISVSLTSFNSDHGLDFVFGVVTRVSKKNVKKTMNNYCVGTLNLK